MKWKLTLRYLFSIVMIVLIVIVVNTFMLIGMLFYQQMRGIEEVDSNDNENFTRQFTQYLSIEQGKPVITEEGIKALDDVGSWIQILDQNGQVVGSALTPEDAPTHYSPIELVQKYKYMDDNFTTYFIGEFQSYSYLIGVQDSKEERLVLMLNMQSILSYVTKALTAVTIVDLLIAMLIGFLFSTILTKPITYMIHQISQLKMRNFSIPKTKNWGIYKPVFSNLIEVSKTLQSHEIEREKLEKMREEWISNVTHDLKTPLASVQGYAELLQGENVTESERLEYAEVIERKSIYMKELIDDFNLTMRLRNQEMPLHLEEIPMESFVRELVIDVLNDPQFGEYEISFDSEGHGFTWNIDPHLMKRAILNFIYNALLHNNTRVVVSVHVTQHSVLIEDNGKGIAPHDLDKVFERYYRGTNTENVRGTGLGMALSRDIIHAHGGTVHISSEVDVGTKIEIQMNQ